MSAGTCSIRVRTGFDKKTDGSCANWVAEDLSAAAKIIVDLMCTTIGGASLARIDYVDLVDAENLQPIEVVRPNSLLALAVFFGKTRLIDNILLA